MAKSALQRKFEREFRSTGARVLAEWFGECWHEAGGRSFPIPAYIHHHDRSQYFRLGTKRWVKESDVWPG
jgi:hypothetical protein